MMVRKFTGNHATAIARIFAVLLVLFSAMHSPAQQPGETKNLPRLLDIGADKCIPCKMMAPILADLKKDYAGRLEVVFIDVWKNRGAGQPYGVSTIPTQIFYDADGKEIYRHIGFISKEDILAKWKELGVNLEPETAAFSRYEPAKPDTRAKQNICYMCDGDVNSKTRVTLDTPKGDVHLCGPHCYFITYSSLTNTTGVQQRVHVTDWATGKSIAAATATYLMGQDEQRRPAIKAFAQKSEAEAEMRKNGGNLADWQALADKELATRCGFCDRAVYPEDASRVKVGSLNTFGCCPMCALGVAARLKKDIEIEQKDALTGENVRVVTLNGSVSKLEPPTAVAWFGSTKTPDGKTASAGCFKQAFFVNPENLKKWVEAHPTATGSQISIGQALADKMKLKPEQIAKACKIGECEPK